MFQHSRYHLPFRNSIFFARTFFSSVFTGAASANKKCVPVSVAVSVTAIASDASDILEEITTTVSQSFFWRKDNFVYSYIRPGRSYGRNLRNSTFCHPVNRLGSDDCWCHRFGSFSQPVFNSLGFFSVSFRL